MIVNGHFRDKFYGSTKMTKPNCLAGLTNVSYQCILLRCMAQAHANGFSGCGLVLIGLFT